MITAIYYDLQNTLLKKYTIKGTKITHDSKIILQLNMIWTRLRLHWLRWYKPCLSFALIVVCNAKPCMPILHYFHVTDKIINQITFNMCQQKHFFFFFYRKFQHQQISENNFCFLFLKMKNLICQSRGFTLDRKYSWVKRHGFAS